MRLKNKILIVIGSFKIGGAERMAITIGEALLEEGFNVHWAIQKPIYQIPHNIDLERIHVLNNKLESKKYYHHLNNIFQINKLGREFKPDVVIAFTYFSSFLSCFTFCKNIIGTFDVNPYLLGKKRHRISDFVCNWRSIKKIVGPSKGTVKELKEARPQFSEKFITIYNSLDFEKVEKLSQQDSIGEDYLNDRPYICAMGRLSEQKNFSLLISSYANSKIKDKFNLIIIGDGPLKEKLNEEVKNLNLTGNIFLLGFKTNPYPYLKNAKFFVNTSNYESFCMVILEALSLGKMVIATDCHSGPREMVNEKNGYLVETNNQTELVNVFNKITIEPEIINIKNANAIDSVSKFRINAISPKWIKLLGTLN